MIFERGSFHRSGGEGKTREFDAERGFDAIIAKQIYEDALENGQCGASAVAKRFSFSMTTARKRLKDHGITTPQRKPKSKKLRA